MRLMKSGNMRVWLIQNQFGSPFTERISDTMVVRDIDTFEGQVAQFDVRNLDSLQQCLLWRSPNDMKFVLNSDTAIILIYPSTRLPDTIPEYDIGLYLALNFENKVRYFNPESHELEYLKKRFISIEVPYEPVKDTIVHYFILE